MASREVSPGLTLYQASFGLLKLGYSGFLTGYTVVRACFAGFWLGLLDRDALLSIADRFYQTHERYRDDAYNKSGAWPWERAVLERYFKASRRLVLVGAGGGREVIALERLGYEVVGYECNERLVAAANELLEGEGLESRVAVAPPDVCPPGDESYDGLIVGWGAYMLIQGRSRRTALLRSLRRQAVPGAPLLVSFFTRPESARRFRLIAGIANVLRSLRSRERIEVGDDLAPEYVHYFTREELASELAEGGFRLEHHATEPYGHAVAIAV